MVAVESSLHLEYSSKVKALRSKSSVSLQSLSIGSGLQITDNYTYQILRQLPLYRIFPTMSVSTGYNRRCVVPSQQNQGPNTLDFSETKATRPTIDTTAAPTTFPKFRKMPPELRDMIWGHATNIPDSLKVTMKDCLCSHPKADQEDQECKHDCNKYFLLFDPHKDSKYERSAILQVSRESRAAALRHLTGSIPTSLTHAPILFNPYMTSFRIQNMLDLLSRVEFDDVDPKKLASWICPRSYAGEGIMYLAIHAKDMVDPIPGSLHGSWFRSVWISLLRQMFPDLQAIFVTVDVRGLWKFGHYFHDDNLPAESGHKKEEEDTRAEEDDEFHLPPRIFKGSNCPVDCHQNMDRYEGLIADFVDRLSDDLVQLSIGNGQSPRGPIRPIFYENYYFVPNFALLREAKSQVHANFPLLNFRRVFQEIY